MGFVALDFEDAAAVPVVLVVDDVSGLDWFWIGWFFFDVPFIPLLASTAPLPLTLLAMVPLVISSEAGVAVAAGEDGDDGYVGDAKEEARLALLRFIDRLRPRGIVMR